MKNNLSLVCANRLKQVLVIDKQINTSLINVIKSDLLYALKNYMEINSDDLNVEIFIDDYGFYDLKVNAKVRRVKTFNSLKE